MKEMQPIILQKKNSTHIHMWQAWGLVPSPRDGQIAQSLRTWQKHDTDVQAFTHMPHTHMPSTSISYMHASGTSLY